MDTPAPEDIQTSPAQGDAEARRRAELALLSVASHDLRGALANVRSYASFLKGGGAPASAERLARSTEVILRNADRALQLAQDFFDAQRSELGHLPVDPEPCAPGPLLQRALASCAPLVSEREAQLLVDLPPQLPELSLDPQRFVHAAAAFIAQGLWRTAAHGALLVEVARQDGAFRVSVHDTGPRLEAQQLAAWFDPRYRAWLERKLEPGFRLCLAKREIEALGGRAGVVTGTDATTHWFELPLPL